ncbi:serine protease 33 [Parasteatoda tepidariorum]|nr:trypsin-3 [Parasteatoda tepidariorum]
MLDARWRVSICIFIASLTLFQPADTFLGISVKREDDGNACYHDGGRCVFFLFCPLMGGTSVSSCPGTIASTCCITYESSNLRRSPTKHQTIQPQPYIQPADGLNQRVLRKDKAVCGERVYKPTSRIVGGNTAEFGEFPWQAHIKITQQQCGGVLLNHHYVVTAAHCVYRALLRDVIVVLGAYDIHDQRYQLLPAQKFRVVEKLLHPNFRFSPSHPDRYDVALIQLDRPARYQENVLPICLPPQGWNFEGRRGIITGWGKTDPALSNRYGTRLLHKVEIPIISNYECEMWHHWKRINLRIFPEMMCAGYEGGRKDACVGDSGGPLIVYLDGRWTLAGIISAGFGCAQWRQPGIYHRVSFTVDWISKNIKLPKVS